MFKIAKFSRGDLIIDKTLDRHGLIVETSRTTIKVKWIKKSDSFYQSNSVSFRTEYVRKQILNGSFVHREKTDNSEEG